MPAKKDDKAPVEEVKEVATEAKEEVKEEKKKEVKADSKATNIGDKKHGNFYNDVEVNCICGANFTINTTVPGPIKVETCYQCHPVYNKDKVIKKVVKGRLEKFLEKQKRIDAMKK